MLKSARILRNLASAAFCICLVATILYAVHRHFYPHGLRAGMLPTFMAAMRAYAEEHGGWYPKGANTPLESLQKLYPGYESEGLAGLSGSERRTSSLLKSNKTLDDSAS